MSKVSEDVIAKLREHPDGNSVFVIPESHRAAVLEGLAQAERGECVPESEMSGLS